MSRGKRHRPLRTGVKRRWGEWKAEAVVRFRYFSVTFHSYLYYIVSFVYRSLDNNSKAVVVGALLGQSGRGGKGGQGSWDESATLV